MAKYDLIDILYKQYTILIAMIAIFINKKRGVKIIIRNIFFLKIM